MKLAVGSRSVLDNRSVAVPTETERYIRFQLEHLSARNEHHTFEEISFRIAERRLSSNILPATGPVSAGGDQGRDAESYYTSLPEELPRAGGFVGRATTKPLVLAVSVQKDNLESKVRSDLRSICTQGELVERVAFFAVHEIPVAARHGLQQHARETYRVSLEIFDGQAVANMLAQSDLAWVAQRYLDLPSHLLPDEPEDPQPGWYTQTLTALRERAGQRLTQGTFSEVRDGLRHATFDDEARVDLPEWLRYMREFIDENGDADLAVRARYECAVATLRGTNTLGNTEDDIRAVMQHAVASDTPSLLEDASVLLLYWGGAWSRHIGNGSAGEIHRHNQALRAHVQSLINSTDESTHPIRKARLLAVAAHLCLQPRWPEVQRPPAGTLPTPQETTLRRLEMEQTGEDIILDTDLPLDVSEAMGHLASLVGLLPEARAFAVGTISQTFQMLAPVLAGDPRYEAVRDALDAADALVAGDHAVADRCLKRALAFRRSNRPLDALREMHNAKVNWWHGDTLRMSLLAMRLIGQIYAELRLVYAAKQYALGAAAIAAASGDAELQDQVPEALVDAMDRAYAIGNWADALALAKIAALAHHSLAESAFNYDAHPSLRRIDFDCSMIMLTAERFRPAILPVLRGALGNSGYEQGLEEVVGELRPVFTYTEQQFVARVNEQLAGRPFSDLGPRRTLAFAGLGTRWWITCSNDRRSVLAAERFAAGAQILLVELAAGDPVFLSQDVRVELLVGTPLGDEGPVRFKPDNGAVVCTVVLRPFSDSTDPEGLGLELAAALVYLFSHLSARPQEEFMVTVDRAFAGGLTHKLHTGRPYDEVAGVLDDTHYSAAAAVVIEPLHGTTFRPTAADALRAPTTAGPGYDRDAALADIQEKYEYLPTLLNRTLPRALADPDTLAGFYELRRDGWLDWQILFGVFNAAFNVRARAAGLLRRPGATREQQQQLARKPENDESTPIPLAALSTGNLRSTMEVAVLAVAQRRWYLNPGTPTPNSAALIEILKARYGFASDDVPHRDLLSDALADGTLLPLIEG